jgi:hypothetical protein
MLVACLYGLLTIEIVLSYNKTMQGMLEEISQN